MYAEIKDGVVTRYPVSVDAIRLENPNVSFPGNLEVNLQCLADFSVYRVFPTPQPAFDPNTQKVMEVTPVAEEGRWVQSWQVIDLDQAEISLIVEAKAADVRAERNRLLTESDWTQVADAPVDQVAWKNYRQALRDITLQADFPMAVHWPSMPV